MLSILIQYHEAFLKGLLVSGELLSLIALIGVPLGIFLGVVAARFWKPLIPFLRGLYFFASTVPVLVLLFWLHYPLQSLLHVVINPFWTTTFALALVNTLITSELILNELNHFPESFRDVGKTLGLSKQKLIRYIELPIIARRSIPTLLSNQGKMLEYTLFASLISVPEIFRVAQNVNSVVYEPVKIYSLLVIFFLAILGPLHLLVNYLKKTYVV